MCTREYALSVYADDRGHTHKLDFWSALERLRALRLFQNLEDTSFVMLSLRRCPWKSWLALAWQNLFKELIIDPHCEFQATKVTAQTRS